MGVFDPQDVARGLMLGSTRRCYILNIIWFQRRNFFSSSHNQSMGDIDPLGVASFDPRGLIGRIYEERGSLDIAKY